MLLGCMDCCATTQVYLLSIYYHSKVAESTRKVAIFWLGSDNAVFIIV